MYSWERRAADNITNAQHMRDVRRRIDLEYQDHLRRRERERADAEVKREVHTVRSPSPPQSNKFKSRTYERPWAQEAPATSSKKPSFSGSMKPNRSETRNSLNKGSVSRLPAISSGTQSRTAAELATSSKTPRRATVPLATHCTEPSLQCPKHRSVDMKSRAFKLSSYNERSNTMKQTQSQDTLRLKNKTRAPCDHLDKLNLSTRHDPVRTLDSHSLPQPLTSPGRSYTDWPRLPSLQYRTPSPEDDALLQLISDPFEDFSEDGSVPEEDLSSSEITYRGGLSTRSLTDTCPSSIQESLPSQCPSSTGTLENPLNDSFGGPLSAHFRTLDVLSSESDREDSDAFPTWQETDRQSYYVPVEWTGSQSSSPDPSPSHSAARSPRDLPSQLSESSIPRESSSRASFSSSLGYSPMPSLVQVGRISISSPSPSVTERVHRGTITTPDHIDQRLPELELNPRRRAPRLTWLGSGRRLEAASPRPMAIFPGRDALLLTRQEEVEEEEEPEEVEGAGSYSREEEDTPPSSTETSHPGTTGMMDHLTMALAALHDIRREVAQIQTLNNNPLERSGTASQEGQSAPQPSNPETLRRIKESLLEESSDDEEGDQCRICQSGAGSPTNPLLTPCLCAGSLQYIHHDCLKTWIQTKIQSGSTLTAVKTCELCKGSLTLDLDFDVEEFYQRHGQTQVERASPELYMMLVLRQISELLQVTQSRSNAVSRIATRLYVLQRTAGRPTNLETSTPSTPLPETESSHQRGPESQPHSNT